MKPSQNPVVWSSEAGDLRKQEARKAQPKEPVPARQQTVYLERDSKNRAGKRVTLLRGLQLPETELALLAKTLKQSLGCGGTVKEGLVELQYEKREKIAEILQKLGYRVKIAGG